MSELVTGEAVALELRPAKLPSRALAVLLDLLVTWTVYILVMVGLLAATGSLDDAAVAALSVAAFLLVPVGGPIVVETLSHGRSLGKMACGLRVVRDDGGPIRFRHALVRGAIGVVEILGTFGVVACAASLVSERGRRLGDVFAGTLVVRERVPVARMPMVPPPPPWLAERFAGVDLSGVPDALWLAVRQYLTRMGQLDPQVGGAMAERLAADLAACTGAPAPDGMPAAMYLTAVVHERQARDARRAFGPAPASGASADPGGLAPGAAAPSADVRAEGFGAGHRHEPRPRLPGSPVGEGQPRGDAPPQRPGVAPAETSRAEQGPPPAGRGTGFAPPS